MKPALRCAVVLLLIGVAGCSVIAPYEAAPPADNQYSVCYNRIGTTPEAVTHIAGAECTGKTKPQLLRDGFDFSACPLLTPMHAVFTCTGPATSHPTP